MQKEYKSFPAEFKDMNVADDGLFRFKGYASVFNNVDYGRDKILPTAFDKFLAKGNSINVLWQHDMREPLGIADLNKDSSGLYANAKLPKDDSLVSGRVIPQMKIGAIKEMSIGFMLKDYSFDEDGVRILKEIELFEISLVTKAMNPKALVDSFKSFGANTKLPLGSRDKEWDGTQAEARIREFTKSTEIPSEDYRKYFMYFDSEKPENFGSYKLLFADVVDGKPMIMPRAIFAIAGILNGARGGVDIPAEDRNKITTAVNSLYKRMATEFEDESIISPVKKSFETLKDIEENLRRAGFSQTESKTMMSRIKELSNQRDVDGIKQRDVALIKQVQDATLCLDIKNLINKIQKQNDNISRN